MCQLYRVFPPFTNKSSMCDYSGYSLSHFNSLSTQVIGTNINFHKHLSCENFQSRQGALACNIYDLHPGIKTNICMDFTIISHLVMV